MSGKIVTLLAEGFEEIEVVTPTDILRRLGFELVLAGVASKAVTGSHGIKIEADTTMDKIKDEDVMALILPGGMPGTKNLLGNDKVIGMVKRTFDAGKLVAAICAAPIVLGKAGVLKGRKATCYPGFEDQLGGAVHTGARAEKDGNIITGKGPGASTEFAAAIASALGAGGRIDELLAGMQTGNK